MHCERHERQRRSNSSHNSRQALVRTAERNLPKKIATFCREYGSKKTTPTFTLDDVYTRKDASDTEFPMATPKNEQQAAVKSEQSQADNVSDDVQILEPQPEESKEENAEPNKEEIDMDELVRFNMLFKFVKTLPRRVAAA